MAERKKTLLGVLLVSALVHWFALDGMRADEGRQLKGPALNAHLVEPQASPLLATPPQPQARSEERTAPAARRSARVRQDVMREESPSRDDLAVPERSKSDAEGLVPAFRAMSLAEVQALARVQIGLAMRGQRVRLTEPLVVVIRLSSTGTVEIVSAEPALERAVQPLCAELSAVLARNPQLLRSLQVSPLEIEFLP